MFEVATELYFMPKIFHGEKVADRKVVNVSIYFFR